MKGALIYNIRKYLTDSTSITTEDILASIMNENNYDTIEECYNFLSTLNNSSYEDLEVIINALKSRMNALEEKYELEKQMRELQERNNKLQGLSLIKSNKENNDVLKDVTYLKYVDKDNNTLLLEITDEKKLANLLTGVAPTMTCQEFYNLLKTRYFNELKKYSLGKDKINLIDYENNYLIKDKSAFIVEKDLLEEFINNNYPNVVPEISVDSNGERIYYVDSIIIKFHDEFGKRKMDILSGDEKMQKDKQENAELTQDVKTETSYKDSIADEITRSDLEGIEVDIEEVKPLLGKYVSNQPLEKSEKIKVYAFLLNLLDIMELDLSISETEKEYLGACIDYLRGKELNSIESEILNRYDNKIVKDEEAYKLENEGVRKKELLPEALKPSDNGATLSIIIITTTLLLGALIAAIILVK